MSVGGIELVLCDVAEGNGHMQMTLNFECGGLGYLKEADELLGATAPEPLRDVGHDGHGRTANLIAQPKIASEIAIVRKAIYFYRQFPCFLPSLDVLKSLYSHAAYLPREGYQRHNEPDNRLTEIPTN